MASPYDEEQAERQRHERMREALTSAYQTFEPSGEIIGLEVRWDHEQGVPIVEEIQADAPDEPSGSAPPPPHGGSKSPAVRGARESVSGAPSRGLTIPFAKRRFSGLHPGAQLLAADLGAVTCLLTTDHVHPTHLLTAGHLFTSKAKVGQPVFAAMAKSSSPVRVGHLVRDFLDEPPARDLQHWLTGRVMDVALVELEVDGKTMATASRKKGPRFRDLLSPVGLEATAGRVLRTMSEAQSRSVALSYSPDEPFQVAPRPVMQGTATRAPYTLRQLVRCPRVTDPRDSGTALICAPPEAPAGIGLCVGATGRGESVFEVLDLVLWAVRQVNGCNSVEIWE